MQIKENTHTHTSINMHCLKKKRRNVLLMFYFVQNSVRAAKIKFDPEIVRP